jgi:hypothetical protein
VSPDAFMYWAKLDYLDANVARYRAGETGMSLVIPREDYEATGSLPELHVPILPANG